MENWDSSERDKKQDIWGETSMDICLEIMDICFKIHVYLFYKIETEKVDKGEVDRGETHIENKGERINNRQKEQRETQQRSIEREKAHSGQDGRRQN